MFKLLERFFKIKNYRFSDEDFTLWKEKIAFPKAHKEIVRYEETMGNTYCPIAKENCLLDSCLHYTKPYINYRNGNNHLGFEPYFWVDKPECKLWSKK